MNPDPNSNSTAHWMFVDEDRFAQPLTRKDRADLDRLGSQNLYRRLWIRTGLALVGCAVAITAALNLTGPVAICLTLAVGLFLLAVAAANSSRVRRIQAALNVELVIRHDVLDPQQPRTHHRRTDLPAVAKGTVRRGPSARDRCDFH